jgi:hypothetical protein
VKYLSILYFILFFWIFNLSTGLAQTTNPVVGTSTLDNLRPSRGDRIELEFPSGFRCKVESGDTPSLVIYGDQGSFYGVNASRVGIALIIPFYEKKSSTCDLSMKLQDKLSVLEIADKLVMSGTLSNDEYKSLVTKIKNSLMNTNF